MALPAQKAAHDSARPGPAARRPPQGVLASGGEDKQVLLWDIDAVAPEPESKRSKAGLPSELLFVHAGHRHGKVRARPCMEAPGPGAAAACLVPAVRYGWLGALMLQREGSWRWQLALPAALHALFPSAPTREHY
jgi:hypothetical protein